MSGYQQQRADYERIEEVSHRCLICGYLRQPLYITEHLAIGDCVITGERCKKEINPIAEFRLCKIRDSVGKNEHSSTP